MKGQTQSLDNHNEHSLQYNERVKRAEIKLAAFFADHNVAFSTVDHLIPLIKDICIKPENCTRFYIGPN